jgi:hypothetical protein
MALKQKQYQAHNPQGTPPPIQESWYPEYVFPDGNVLTIKYDPKNGTISIGKRDISEVGINNRGTSL